MDKTYTLPSGKTVTYQLVKYEHPLGYGEVIGSAIVTMDGRQLTLAEQKSARSGIQKQEGKPNLFVLIGEINS